LTWLKNDMLKHLLILLVVVVPLFSLGITNHGLWSADEPRVAEIGREMALSGNWAVPMLNQKPFLEEPPLYYGALALIFKAFGNVSDKAARIPSALFCLGGIVALFFLANLLFGPRIGLFSGLILATTGEYFRVAHWVIVDSALTFFVLCASALFIAGYLAESSRKKLLYYILLYVSCTFAFYSKGFIGIVIPGLGVLAFLAIERNWKELIRMRLWLGVIVFLILTTPWFVALWQQAGTEYLKVFFVHNHLQRFLPASMAGSISGAASGHHHPFYYYLTEFPSGFLPWSIILIPALYLTFSAAGKLQGLSEKGRLFAKCWFFAGFIFLSIASTKRVLYLMPIFAPISMLTALYIDYTISKVTVPGPLKRVGSIFMWVFGILLLLIGSGLTPALFFVRKLYVSALPAGLTVSVIALSAVVIVLSMGSIYFLFRGELRKYWGSLYLAIVTVLGFTLVAVMPVLDRHKSFVPFSTEVAAAVPVGEPLYAYQPDETLRGAVPFYTGRQVSELEELPEVLALIDGKDRFFIMIRDRKGEMEKELSATGRLHIRIKQFMGTDRTLLLLSKEAVENPVIIEDPMKEMGNRKHGGAASP
jgi:4-amino-4-deoxy-L-arabinose transferase-like glycosyltransferase